MKKDVKVEFLKAKNLDTCIELIKEKGKFNILSEYANFYDRRTYFKVNENGDIEITKGNVVSFKETTGLTIQEAVELTRD